MVSATQAPAQTPALTSASAPQPDTTSTDPSADNARILETIALAVIVVGVAVVVLRKKK